jgi:ABC-type polysaccharide/polyol phosphate export permease
MSADDIASPNLASAEPEAIPVYDSRDRKSATGYIGELWHYRHFIAHMARSLLRSRLRRSSLGVVWIVLEPMILAAIFTFVFGQLFQVDDIVAYAIYVLIGHVGFSMFAQALSVSTNALLEGKVYMEQSRVPAMAFPIRTLIYIFTSMLIAFSGVLAVGFGTGRMDLTLHLLWLPPFFMFLFVVLLPMGVMSALANLKFGDFSQILQYLLQLLYYLTPVFLPREFFDRPEVIPLETTSPTIALLDVLRDILTGGQAPELKDIAVLAIWGLVAWIAAIAWMRKEERRVVYYS